MTKTGLWSTVLGIFIGMNIGIGGYLFVYAKGASYLRDDPAVCVNCHIMRNQFDGWVKGTHHADATCNDCHIPRNVIGKYRTKALNGFWHSYYFTVGTYPDNILITRRNRRVAENNCRRCHQDIVDQIDREHSGPNGLACISCHGSVGHS